MGLYEDMVAEENRLALEEAAKETAGKSLLLAPASSPKQSLPYDRYPSPNQPTHWGGPSEVEKAKAELEALYKTANDRSLLSKALDPRGEDYTRKVAELRAKSEGQPQFSTLIPEKTTPTGKQEPPRDMKTPPGGLILGSKSIFEKTQAKPVGGLKAYKTPDGKVYFSNNIPTEDATEVAYTDEATKMRKQIRGDLGLSDSGPGTVSTPQGTDEMIRDRAARDAMMKNMAAEMSMTPEEKFNRQLDQSKRLAQVQSDVATQGTINEYTKLAELMGGARVLPDENPDSPFNRRKAELYTKFKGTPEGAKKSDAEVWKDAWEAAKQEFDQQFAQQVWGVFLTRNRATSAPILPGDEATGG